MGMKSILAFRVECNILHRKTRAVSDSMLLSAFVWCTDQSMSCSTPSRFFFIDISYYCYYCTATYVLSGSYCTAYTTAVL